MKATVEDENLQGKISDEDKQKILDKCNEIINWLDKNQTAEKEEFKHQQKSWRKSAILSLPNCTRAPGACQEECLEASLVVELLPLVVPPLDPPSKRNGTREIEAEGKWCDLGISNAAQAQRKREAQHHGRPRFLLWGASLHLSGTFRPGGLGIIWKQHMGLNIFILRRSLISPCNGRTSRSHCPCGEYGQDDLASSGRSTDITACQTISSPQFRTSSKLGQQWAKTVLAGKCVDQANVTITRQQRYGFTFPMTAAVASKWISVGQKPRHFPFDGMKLPKPFCNHEGSQPTTDEDMSEDVVEKQSWSLWTNLTLKPSLPRVFGPTAVIGL
ncbi:hypothetical protein GH733_007049 [Mirounga leonina]|nr:hypothetical protein GH733_007049 [Mirounga leonina]